MRKRHYLSTKKAFSENIRWAETAHYDPDLYHMMTTTEARHDPARARTSTEIETIVRNSHDSDVSHSLFLPGPHPTIGDHTAWEWKFAAVIFSASDLQAACIPAAIPVQGSWRSRAERPARVFFLFCQPR